VRRNVRAMSIPVVCWRERPGRGIILLGGEREESHGGPASKGAI
jgi:hypothetical protein